MREHNGGISIVPSSAGIQGIAITRNFCAVAQLIKSVEHLKRIIALETFTNQIGIKHTVH